MAMSHFIEIADPDGRAEYFCGWGMRGEPDLSPNRDDAVLYDLTFHRDEAMSDYERLTILGFDASIETTGFVNRHGHNERARLEAHFSHQIAAE